MFAVKTARFVENWTKIDLPFESFEETKKKRERSNFQNSHFTCSEIRLDDKTSLASTLLTMVKRYRNKNRPKSKSVGAVAATSHSSFSLLDVTIPEDNHLDSFDIFVNDGKK